MTKETRLKRLHEMKGNESKIKYEREEKLKRQCKEGTKLNKS
jgi:hypothetical protein